MVEGHPADHADLVAVLEVPAHAGQVHADLDPVALQPLARPDARQHEELGRVEGAAGQDHLRRRADLSALARGRARLPVRPVEPLAGEVLDADCASLPVEQHPGREGVELDASRSGCRRATSSTRSRGPVRAWSRVVSGRYPMPTAFSRTSRQSFGSALPWRSHHSRVIGGATSRIARRADFFITLASARSWKTGRMSALLGVEPAGPAVAASDRCRAWRASGCTGRCRQFSSRWKYRRMRVGAPGGVPGQRGDAVPVRRCAGRRGSSRCARCSRRGSPARG